MKARVKATGEMVEIMEDCSYLYAKNYEGSYNINELEFLDVKEKSLPIDEPDYWEKLKHQYAGMAMQGILANNDLLEYLSDKNKDVALSKIIVDNAVIAADVLINKLKEESKCEK